MPTKSFKKNAKWEIGLRPYFEYRDLGIVKATKGHMYFEPNRRVLDQVGIIAMI